MSKHPQQPVQIDPDGVARFKPNRIVQYLLDHGGIDMNKIARLSWDPSNGFTPDEQQHFAQLIGYSVDGYADLSYANDATWRAAQTEAERLLP